MGRKRIAHSAALKARVALAAIKGDRTINEIAGQFGVHPTLIHGWKKQLLNSAESLFERGAAHKSSSDDSERVQAELYEQIGRLKMELEWQKKSCLPQLSRSVL